MSQDKLSVFIKRPRQNPEIRDIDNTHETYEELVGGSLSATPMPNVKGATLIYNKESSNANLWLLNDDIIFGAFVVAGDMVDGKYTSLNEEQQIKIIDYIFSNDASGSGIDGSDLFESVDDAYM